MISTIFHHIECLTQEDGQREFLKTLYPIANNVNQSDEPTYNTFSLQVTFLEKIIKEIDSLIDELNKDESILISVKNQKLLITCYQIITSLGISHSLISGLGVKLSKKCVSAAILPEVRFSDDQKYELLVKCTDFFIRSYKLSVLKKIIITLHLSDYIAALIQLSFAPLKKPGTYENFVMTEQLYAKLIKDRKKYVPVYKDLINNCFQPSIIKELMVLQSVSTPPPPLFVKRFLAKELSQRLLAPGGLLSLIRCFIESYGTDTGFDWKKVDMICKIISVKHGNNTDISYLNNISAQLSEILLLNNAHFLYIAVACILCLNEKYPQADPVKFLVKEFFQPFDYFNLISSCNMPGTIIMISQELERKLYILYICISNSQLNFPHILLSTSLYVLFLLGVKCTKNIELKSSIKEILLNCLLKLRKEELRHTMQLLLFGKPQVQVPKISIEEHNSGLIIKHIASNMSLKKEEESPYFLHLLKSSSEEYFIQCVFEIALQMAIDFNEKRNKRTPKETLLAPEDEPVLFDDVDEKYAIVLQLLCEISTMPKTVSILKSNPMIVFNFIEYFIMKAKLNINDECVTIGLVLLNTILSNSKRSDEMQIRFSKFIPVLELMKEDQNAVTSVLCEEALSLINSEKQSETETAFKKALSDAFDDLLPVRAHGLIALTKLIEAGDSETICKKHYIFCLFQEQLKDPDSYIYLSAINGIASLGTHCTDDVLHILCKEFLQIHQSEIHTEEIYNRNAELRMKIGDAIVKVIKRLGEMAIVHKTILLNTMLCGCRDEDPLIRTSALSNLAEIALVLHYKMGGIIYELLHCIWDILETDKAIECRRAAVMIISSLIKGLGRDVLIQLKDNLLPIYRTLKRIYSDEDEDSVMRLHAQIALEELNDIVKQFIFPEVNLQKQIFVLDKPDEVWK